jgi:hypothetical protein
MPDRMEADTPFWGWVRAFAPGSSSPYPLPLPEASLTAEGPAALDLRTLRLAEAAGRFRVEPRGPGLLRVRAEVRGRSAAGEIQLLPVEEKPRILWDFEEASPPPSLNSSWGLVSDASVKPNQRVLRVDFQSRSDRKDNQRLLTAEGLEAALGRDRARIGGVVLDLALAPSFRCQDKDARIEVIMQSNGNYWMALGSLPLDTLSTQWRTVTVRAENPEHRRVMEGAFNIILNLVHQTALGGSLYLDRLGVLLR